MRRLQDTYIVMGQNSTSPTLKLTFYRNEEDGPELEDFETCVVAAQLVNNTTDAIVFTWRSLTMVTDSEFRLSWTDTDLATLGLHRLHLRITHSNGTVEYAPYPLYVSVV